MVPFLRAFLIAGWDAMVLAINRFPIAGVIRNCFMIEASFFTLIGGHVAFNNLSMLNFLDIIRRLLWNSKPLKVTLRVLIVLFFEIVRCLNLKQLVGL
jgi:hypothetical protein